MPGSDSRQSAVENARKPLQARYRPPRQPGHKTEATLRIGGLQGSGTVHLVWSDVEDVDNRSRHEAPGNFAACCHGGKSTPKRVARDALRAAGEQKNCTFPGRPSS